MKTPRVTLYPCSFYELTPQPSGDGLPASFLVLPTTYSSPSNQNDPSKGSVTSFLPMFKVPPWTLQVALVVKKLATKEP